MGDLEYAGMMLELAQGDLKALAEVRKLVEHVEKLIGQTETSD